MADQYDLLLRWFIIFASHECGWAGFRQSQAMDELRPRPGRCGSVGKVAIIGVDTR